MGRDGAIEVLVGQRRNLRHIGVARFSQEEVGDFGGRHGGKHRADVDGHVEKAEAIVAESAVFGLVVEVAHHHLEIALEQARSNGNQGQSREHGDFGGGCGHRYGQQQVAEKHHDDSRADHLAITETVGQHTTYEGHEVDATEEDAVNITSLCLVVAELGLQEEHEDGQHGIIAKALARVGEGERIEAFRMSLKHS